MSMYSLWCLIEGGKTVFDVTMPIDSNISQLKGKIKQEYSPKLEKFDATDLILWKIAVNARDPAIEERINAGQYRPQPLPPDPLDPCESISVIWPGSPPNDCLHIFVELPMGGLRPAIPQTAGDKPVDSGLVQEYKNIFIRVKARGSFEHSDIDRNDFYEHNGTAVPDFVAEPERKSDAKPGLASDAFNSYKAVKDVEFLNAYFGPPKRCEDESPEEFIFENESHRAAGHSEMVHLAYVATYSWEKFWYGDLGMSLGKLSMNAIFLHCFAVQPGGSTTALRTAIQPWPFSLIVQCEDIQPELEQLRRYQPRSDLLVLKSGLPRLLVEVNSKPLAKTRKAWPEDLIRMLLMGGAIVRLANGLMANRNFVLFAIYIWDHGVATRFSLFQMPGSQTVYYRRVYYELNTPVGRAKFVRLWYNLRHMIETDEETENVKAGIERLQNKIRQHDRQHHLESFYTMGKKRKRPNNDVDDRGAGGGGGARGVCATDSAELRTHGYELKPQEEDIVDEKGGVMTPLSRSKMMLSHILTVYQQSDPSKRFIAKKVHEQSNELEFLKYLNTLQPKSEHIISLRESFQTQSTSWAIVPEMESVTDYVSFLPGRLYGKIAQVCWGLIKGVAYLHKFCIAHRDIKPENLVVDRDFCLKIIDFDVAIRVKGEDEMVEGQCGTKGWMAPEMEESSIYSPIKADRWSTGQVLLYLLDELRKEDTVLRTTAMKLTAHNPDQRSSMLQVAALLSDMTNMAIERNTSRSLQDTVEVVGESAKPPRVKKRKLSVSDRPVWGDLGQ